MSVPMLSAQQQQALTKIIAAINQSAVENNANVTNGLSATESSTSSSSYDDPRFEAAFKKRLETAMLRNFDYIRRYDVSYDRMRVRLRL